MIHLVTFVWGILNTVFRGYLIKTFWAWFIVSQFPQLPLISILPAIGFSFFVGALAPWKGLTAADLENNLDADEKVKLNLISCGAYSLGIAISLGCGWIVHHFM